MEESVTSPAEKNRKRKNKAELVQSNPLLKHVCLGHSVDDSSSSIPSKKLQKLDQLDTGSENASNSHHDDYSLDDSPMFSYDEANTDTISSDDFCTSSSNWDGSSFCDSLYSSDSRSFATSNLSKTESLNISDEHNCPDNYGFMNENTEDCHEMGFENLLNPNEAASSNDFILSSGRWIISKNTLRDETTPTIDKEFEQYFSMLML